MFQNPEVPAQDQDHIYEIQKQKINQYYIKIKQIESIIADGLNCKHEQSLTIKNLEQKVEQMNDYCQNSKLHNWDFKVKTMMINLLNGFEIIKNSSQDVDLAQNSIAKILMEE